MNKTEKVALREAVIVVMMGAVINFPLQTYLLWLTIDNWQWSDPIKISIFIQAIISKNTICGKKYMLVFKATKFSSRQIIFFFLVSQH